MENKQNTKPVESQKGQSHSENRDGKNKQNYRRKNYRHGKKNPNFRKDNGNENRENNSHNAHVKPDGELKAAPEKNQEFKPNGNNNQGDRSKPRHNKKHRYNRNNRKKSSEQLEKKNGLPNDDAELVTASPADELDNVVAHFSYETPEIVITAVDESDAIIEDGISGYGVISESDGLDSEKASEPVSETAEPEELVEIIGVYFKKSGKVYYFDPSGFTVSRDDHVIVETVRGLEFGYVSVENRMVPAREIVPPLRKVVRIATEEDENIRRQNEQKEIEAFNICLTKIEEHNLDMKLVEVEYTFDNSKLLFYFTSEGRVDFRELVKDLATVFRTRIELRQIGIRDEAKMMGGLGICGRPFCCKTFLPDFVQVSIKMAKEQNISLNSTKISGACNRLMCCLRYEYDTYLAEAALTPKVGSEVLTPDGEGIVTETTPINGIVKVTLKQHPEKPPVIYHRDDLKLVVKDTPSK